MMRDAMFGLWVSFCIFLLRGFLLSMGIRKRKLLKKSKNFSTRSIVTHANDLGEET